LFAAAADTLLEFGRNPRWLGGEIAATLLLHTWSQTLIQHPHVHALVPGGALGCDGRWIWPRRGFLFPVAALSAVFRGKFLDALCRLLQKDKLKLAGSTAALSQPRALRAFVATLHTKAWVVYAKQSLTGPDKVLDYLARYTHKTAISNHRLLSADEHTVRFAYRDRAKGNRQRIMQLPAMQFLERFVMHVLPRGFMRIRHYGLLANRNKARLLANAASALSLPPPQRLAPESLPAFCLRVFGRDIDLCPRCGIGRLGLLTSLLPVPPSRAPPAVSRGQLRVRSGGCARIGYAALVLRSTLLVGRALPSAVLSTHRSR
jgi:hypothetical protein